MRLVRPGLLGGVLLIVVGSIWFLNNLGLTEVSLGDHLARLWPAVLVYAGGVGLAAQAGRGSHLFRVINGGLALLGLLLLTANYDLIPFTSRDIGAVAGPLLLIIVGLGVMRFGTGTGRGATQWAVMGGLELGKNPFTFQETNLVAFMGGGKIDLSRAKFAEPEVRLDCLAVMGGWEIHVPADVRVAFEGFAVMGGHEVLGEGSGGLISDCSVPPVEVPGRS